MALRDGLSGSWWFRISGFTIFAGWPRRGPERRIPCSAQYHTEQKRKQIAKEIKSEFDQNAQMTRLQLQHLEAELERLLQWKPKEKKRPIPQKKTNAQLRNEKLADIPDLFNL